MGIEQEKAPPSKPTLLVSFGVWLSVKKNFLMCSMAIFGGPLYTFFFVWLRIGYGMGGPTAWLIIALMAAIGGYVWGLLMWQFFSAKRQEWRTWGNRDD